MEAWPFRKEEWAKVSDAALLIVNASSAEDDVLQASHFAGLQEVLADLQATHGEHPVLLETEADFTNDPDESIPLYRQAIRLAEAHSLQTLTIRLSLAQVFLDLGQKEAARLELLACQHELVDADTSDREAWVELANACQ
ncbi:MAG: hypothetical protein ACRC8S_00220 [Fimbriiglobus sp.]